jgi:hypothetical protein
MIVLFVKRALTKILRAAAAAGRDARLLFRRLRFHSDSSHRLQSHSGV